MKWDEICPQWDHITQTVDTQRIGFSYGHNNGFLSLLRRIFKKTCEELKMLQLGLGEIPSGPLYLPGLTRLCCASHG